MRIATSLLWAVALLAVHAWGVGVGAAASATGGGSSGPGATARDRPVLVLGSGGLIGRALVAWLRSQAFEVLEVKNRAHIDLREPGALDRFNASRVQFVYFLACEVGGSKFLESSSEVQQLAIIRNNVRIYQTVLNWFEDEVVRQRSEEGGGVPMRGVFTSSYLQHMHNAYGSVKRIGEEWGAFIYITMWASSLAQRRRRSPRATSLPPSPAARQLSTLKSVRLWNVYGYERIGVKSHVLNDWIWSCVTAATIPCVTDGLEYRQFMHADDVASALGAMQRHFDSLDEVTDVSSGEWLQLRDLGALVRTGVVQSGEAPCTLTFSSTRAAKIANGPAQRLRVEPNLGTPFHAAWKAERGAQRSLADGIGQLASVYIADAAAEPQCRAGGKDDAECAAAPISSAAVAAASR